MNKLFFLPVLLIGMIGTLAFKFIINDEQFVKMASSSNSLEIALGGQAVQKGNAESVKMFGKKMSEHHGKASSELADLAKSKGWKLPQKLERAHQEEVDKLARLNGEKFDREFAVAMLKSHQEAVALFENASGNSDLDADLKRWASEKLPTLKAHLEEAEKLVSQIAGNSSGSRN